MTAIGKQWHPECFVCAHKDCDEELGGSFYPHEGKAYCEEHAPTINKKTRIVKKSKSKKAKAAKAAKKKRKDGDPRDEKLSLCILS